MKRVIGLLFAILLGGCSLTREVPPVQSYHLAGGSVTPGTPLCGDRVIRVALLQAPQWLQGTAIYYTGSDLKMYRYTRARWEQPPVAQLQEIVERTAIESGLFGGVVPYKSLAKNDWLLELRIEKMAQHIDATGHGETELMLYGVLIDQYSRRVIAQKTFRYRHENTGADVQTAVDAWSRSTETFAADLVQWLRQQCEAHPKIDRSDVNL